ncbi:hypothetical protein HNQ99_001022 [Rhizorhapis suberifaciens]|uniref:Uncharacterized protein n=1 Tax=Rhizorhapis suberifaciens TaxID=13656 RepID=A0A840HSZ3_9SPHN|nr:hypothetical protein [Rhizorhapis suberifaciens]
MNDCVGKGDDQRSLVFVEPSPQKILAACIKTKRLQTTPYITRPRVTTPLVEVTFCNGERFRYPAINLTAMKGGLQKLSFSIPVLAGAIHDGRRKTDHLRAWVCRQRFNESVVLVMKNGFDKIRVDYQIHIVIDLD